MLAKVQVLASKIALDFGAKIIANFHQSYSRMF